MEIKGFVCIPELGCVPCQDWNDKRRLMILGQIFFKAVKRGEFTLDDKNGPLQYNEHTSSSDREVYSILMSHFKKNLYACNKLYKKLKNVNRKKVCYIEIKLEEKWWHKFKPKPLPRKIPKEKVIGFVCIPFFGSLPCETWNDKRRLMALGQIYVKGVKRGEFIFDSAGPPVYNKNITKSVLNAYEVINSHLSDNTDICAEILGKLKHKKKNKVCYVKYQFS